VLGVIVLRPYQEAAIVDARAAYARGARAPLIVSPTGSGKTIVLSAIAAAAVAKGGKVIVLAHRKELLEQTLRKMQDCGVRAGVISAALPHLADPSASVQIASIQTLLARSLVPPGDLIIYDEAHHAAAAENRVLLASYPRSKLLGVTATPCRADGAPLGDIFDTIVLGPSVRQLTALGHLVPCRTYAPPTHLKSNLASLPEDAWEQHGRGKRCIIFERNVARGRELTETLRARGARVRFVDGNTAPVLREHALADFAAGTVDTIVNVFVLTEGFDSPSADVCILARSCGAATTYLQAAGRVLRPAPGKTEAILVDLSGATHLHGLVDDDRTYTLDGGISLARLDPLRTCMECGATFRSAPICPQCGAVMAPRKVKPIKITGDPMGEVTRAAIQASRERRHLEDLEQLATTKGFKPAWVSHSFKRKFGKYPETDYKGRLAI